MDDEQILALYFGRDERAVSETERKYGTLCRQLGMHILGNPQDSEECCSDALLNAWNSIPPNRPDSLRAYILKLMRNAALHLYEKLHAEKRGGSQIAATLEELAECVPAPGSIEEEAEARETAASIRQFLRTLPDETRRIFILRYFSMMPVKEIAERCGVGESKVKVTLHRTRNALKEWLGGEIP